jgi:sterol desaturase/sphingolipid hydroxylase (fatty acid hydroxylase superfamily)
MTEASWRLSAFVVVLASMLWAERRWPRRAPTEVPGRILHNVGIVALDQAVVRIFVPLLPVALASARWGGGGLLASSPWWVAAGLGVVALDFAVWVQHVLFHRVPVLWRLHRLHHADTGFDVTTALRFHPAEILLSIGYKLAWVWVLGPPPEAVLAFEIGLNALAMFNHANLALDPRWDAALRRVWVTPDVHRVHHGARADEMHTNFGFSVVWWDKLWGTYRAQPVGDHATMVVGLPSFRGAAEHRLGAMLTQPWRDDPGASGGAVGGMTARDADPG